MGFFLNVCISDDKPVKVTHSQSVYATPTPDQNIWEEALSAEYTYSPPVGPKAAERSPGAANARSPRRCVTLAVAPARLQR